MTQVVTHSADEFATRKVELVLQQLESLPTLPALAVRLLNLTGSSTSKIKEVVELISADPSLTAKVLSLVGSAASGVRQPITTVHQAVVLLGFDAIRNLALSVKVFEVFQYDAEDRPANENPDNSGMGGGRSGGFCRAEFWKHALAVASCAEMLASKCKPRIPGPDAFVCGLLHDLGKVAFDAVMPKSFSRVVEIASLTRGDIAEVERRVIGLDHAMAGKRLAEAWNLPTIISQTIWLHGVAPMSVPGGIINPQMVRLIGLADLLARQQHIGFSGNFQNVYEVRQYVEPLGLAMTDIAEVRETLAEVLEDRAKGIGLYEVQSRKIYLESIANANSELGRVNQLMTAQNRRLAQRSECFELLTQFYQRITPAATPAQLLTEIGQVGRGYLRVPRIVLFSQDPEQRSGEMVIVAERGGAGREGGGESNRNHNGIGRDSRMLTMPPFAGDQRIGSRLAGVSSGGDFLRLARPQLDWLLEHVPEADSSEGRIWRFMPLLCGEQPVGGVLWQENHDEPLRAMEADLKLVSQSWGMTLRSAQMREQHNVLTEALAASNRSLGAVQQQLIRARSLASLGEMAAGAAHEMNNPLAVVCGRAQLLASKLSDPTLKQDAQQIAQQGDRLSQIITDLMIFAKPTAPKLEPVALDKLLEQAIKEMQKQAGALANQIPIHLQVEPWVGTAAPCLMMDAQQISAAVTEILLNAVQASIGENGKVLGAGLNIHIQARVEPTEGQFIIQVSDQGLGMSEETMKQAFAPFYSAKPAGRQRGMGLAKALRWVELHGGTIRLDSQPKHGTTVVILMPAQVAEPTQEPSLLK